VNPFSPPPVASSNNIGGEQRSGRISFTVAMPTFWRRSGARDSDSPIIPDQFDDVGKPNWKPMAKLDVAVMDLNGSANHRR
jgi:hypothetical protein